MSLSILVLLGGLVVVGLIIVGIILLAVNKS